MRITRSRISAEPPLMLWNGAGAHFGYSVGRHHFYFACKDIAHFDEVMRELGCTDKEVKLMFRMWNFGSWGSDANLLPREPGLWVQPYRGAHFIRLYPVPTVKRIRRTCRE